MMLHSKRQLLKAALGGAALAALNTAGMRASASPRKVPYGAAVSLADLRADARLQKTLAETCDVIVPVGELKWAELRPSPDRFSFESADEIAAFARKHGLALRGHTLVWYAAMPDWTKTIASARMAERVLVDHIKTVVSRYRGRITSWDVVNEAIPDAPRNPADRRPSVWSAHLGNDYIPLAFRTAAAADPRAELILNEYDVEFDDAASKAKRAALRNLILELLGAGVPIHGVGIQCHLKNAARIDRDGLSAFVAEMRGHGLKVLVTELDVIDNELPWRNADRDEIIASQVNDVLHVLTAAAPLDALLTWGISDRYSWISHVFPRKDGFANRPLPLDRDFNRKPFMDVIDRFTK
jgi:endo-1,4-beta-xylanase